jgi:ABC-type branched-subunit amino acid transport system ATPase component
MMAETTPKNILEAVQVRKEFGGLIAVNDVDFVIPKGSIVSLIGPNGAARRRSSTSSPACTSPPRVG